MNPKIKILIAREGLIIISLLLLSITLFLVESYVNRQKEAYESNTQYIEPLLIEATATKAAPTTPQDEWVDYVDPATLTARNKDLLLEAERRGILPDDKKLLLAEARKRGLVPPASATEQPQDKLVDVPAPPHKVKLIPVDYNPFAPPSGIVLLFPKNTDNEII